MSDNLPGNNLEEKLTDRETELIQLIAENPMISQTELAEKMGITRSSVSVYITNLSKKGIIRGRGYILSETDYPVVIGTANFDYIGSVAHDFKLYEFDDRDVQLKVSYAGFSKTVSELLVRLNCAPIPIFAVGNDIFGTEIIREMRMQNLPTDHALVVEDMQTAMFLELRDEQTQKALINLSNLQILRCLTPAFMKSKHRILKNASLFAIEDDLPLETVAYLTAAYPTTPLYLLGSNRKRLKQYQQFFDKTELLVLSMDTAEEILDIPRSNQEIGEHDLVHICQEILQSGLQSVLIPCAPQKLCYADKKGCYILSCNAGNENFLYNSCRMPVFAACIYSASAKLPLLEMLNVVAAAKTLAGSEVHRSDYLHTTISLDSIHATQQKNSCSIRCIHF